MKLAALALSLSHAVALVAAFEGGKLPPKGEVGPTDNFVWADPFHDHRLANKLRATCTVERSFPAREFQLHDLYEHEPRGLWAYADTLKGLFKGRPYPGGWDGLDPHMYERPLLLMEYADMPVAVREWIEESGRAHDNDGDDGEEEDEDAKKARDARRHLFAVFERPAEPMEKVLKTAKPPKTAARAALLRPLDVKKVVIFAPGALYGILPLWVADAADTTGAAAGVETGGPAKGAGCGSAAKERLLALEHYAPKPKDGGVIAWTTAHTEPDRSKNERAMTFTIKAQTLQAAGAAAIGHDKDEL